MVSKACWSDYNFAHSRYRDYELSQNQDETLDPYANETSMPAEEKIPDLIGRIASGGFAHHVYARGNVAERKKATGLRDQPDGWLKLNSLSGFAVSARVSS